MTAGGVPGAGGPGTRAAADAALRTVHEALSEAMVLADVAVLDALLTDDCVLTHLTGLRQSKAEWLRAIADDELQYHAVDTVELALALERPDPVLTARTLTEATVRGGHAVWRLQLRSTHRLVGGGWRIASTEASSW